jgi:hypothetical protein
MSCPGSPGRRPSIRTPAPQWGEHNRILLSELGIDDSAYDALVGAGAVCEAGSGQPAPEE